MTVAPDGSATTHGSSLPLVRFGYGQDAYPRFGYSDVLTTIAAVSEESRNAQSHGTTHSGEDRSRGRTAEEAHRQWRSLRRAGEEIFDLPFGQERRRPGRGPPRPDGAQHRPGHFQEAAARGAWPGEEPVRLSPGAGLLPRLITLQLPFPQATQGTAKRKGQVAVRIELFHDHLGLDVQRHPPVVALVHQSDETADGIVAPRELRQLAVAGLHLLRRIFGSAGNAPFPLLAAQRRHFAEKNQREAVAQLDEVQRRERLLAQIGEAAPDHRIATPYHR